MKTIYKYKVKRQETQEVEMPVGAQILTAQPIDVNVWIWAIVETEVQEKEMRRIAVLKTGQEITLNSDQLLYINSVQFGAGELVLHVFEYTGN
ncbi:MAG: hypothetical protein K0Q55_1396 [Verrucomicrobia bacterium]|jgi:hypothetical protein|nr:hypothetical protein [Verrucomicrobiota bacterium]